MSIGILALALLLGLVILAVWFRGRRHGMAAVARAVPVAVAAPALAPAASPGWDDDDDTIAYEEPAISGTSSDLFRPDPYATLAASSDPAGPVDDGDDRAREAEPD